VLALWGVGAAGAAWRFSISEGFAEFTYAPNHEVLAGW
jgi:hypothetical protein